MNVVWMIQLLSRRAFTTASRGGCPLYLHDAGDWIRVSFSKLPQAIDMGRFRLSDKAEVEPAFTTTPDTFEVHELLKDPSKFVENRDFWPVASRALATHIHECPTFNSMASVENRTHFFHIYDLRAPPSVGRIPEVEDILGTAEIEYGKGIIPGTFECNTMYRPVTRMGAMLLSPEMTSAVCKAVESADR